MIKRAFRLWAMSLGQKSGRTNREANIVALIRSMIALVYLITNIVIVAGVVRHWNEDSSREPLKNDYKAIYGDCGR